MKEEEAGWERVAAALAAHWDFPVTGHDRLDGRNARTWQVPGPAGNAVAKLVGPGTPVLRSSKDRCGSRPCSTTTTCQRHRRCRAAAARRSCRSGPGGLRSCPGWAAARSAAPGRPISAGWARYSPPCTSERPRSPFRRGSRHGRGPGSAWRRSASRRSTRVTAGSSSAQPDAGNLWRLSLVLGG